MFGRLTGHVRGQRPQRLLYALRVGHQLVEQGEAGLRVVPVDVEAALDVAVEVAGEVQLPGDPGLGLPVGSGECAQALANRCAQQVVGVEHLAGAVDRDAVDEDGLVPFEQAQRQHQRRPPLLVDLVQPEVGHELPVAAERGLAGSLLLDAQPEASLDLQIGAAALNGLPISPAVLGLDEHELAQQHRTPPRLAAEVGSRVGEVAALNDGAAVALQDVVERAGGIGLRDELADVEQRALFAVVEGRHGASSWTRIGHEIRPLRHAQEVAGEPRYCCVRCDCPRYERGIEDASGRLRCAPGRPWPSP